MQRTEERGPLAQFGRNFGQHVPDAAAAPVGRPQPSASAPSGRQHERCDAQRREVRLHEPFRWTPRRFGGDRELRTSLRIAKYDRDQHASAIRFAPGTTIANASVCTPLAMAPRREHSAFEPSVVSCTRVQDQPLGAATAA